MTDEDQDVIWTGDIAAHHGDPITDAILYDRGLRRDVDTYKTLYGVIPQTVLDHREFTCQ